MVVRSRIIRLEAFVILEKVGPGVSGFYRCGEVSSTGDTLVGESGNATVGRVWLPRCGELSETRATLVDGTTSSTDSEVGRLPFPISAKCPVEVGVEGVLRWRQGRHICTVHDRQ